MVNVNQLNTTTHVQTLQEQPICIISTKQETTKPTHIGKIIFEALDETFSQLKCKQTVLNILNEKYNINQKTIPKKTTEFTQALKEIFKDASIIIEIKTINLLHQKIPNFKHHPKQEITLNSYLQDLSHYWQKNQPKKL